jgi:hypothetical protein
MKFRIHSITSSVAVACIGTRILCNTSSDLLLEEVHQQIKPLLDTFLLLTHLYLLLFLNSIFGQIWKDSSFRTPLVCLMIHAGLTSIWKPIVHAFYSYHGLLDSQRVLILSSVLGGTYSLMMIWVLIRLFKMKEKPFLSAMRFWGYATIVRMVSVFFYPIKTLVYLRKSMVPTEYPELFLNWLSEGLMYMQSLPDFVLLFTIISHPSFWNKPATEKVAFDDPIK